MKTYCKECEEKTSSIFNDFMVEFCYLCKGRKSSHSVPVAYKCCECGVMNDEGYIGQIMCEVCARSLLQDRYI